MTTFVMTVFVLYLFAFVFSLFEVAVKEDPKERFVSVFQAVFAGGFSIWAAILLFA